MIIYFPNSWSALKIGNCQRRLLYVASLMLVNRQFNKPFEVRRAKSPRDNNIEFSDLIALCIERLLIEGDIETARKKAALNLSDKSFKFFTRIHANLMRWPTNAK